MHALVYDGQQLRFDNTVAAPTPHKNEVLLKIRLAGICNTDLELMAGYKGFTGIPGHEFVGTVTQGPVELLGQRVVGDINVACGQCDFCAQGIPSQCRNRKAVGIWQYPGAFAEYMPLPIANLHSVPGSISDDQAVFVEPLAAALQIMESIPVSPRDRVIILGPGKLGLLVAQVLRLTGAEVIVPVRRDKQRQLLNLWGIQAVERSELSAEQAQIVVDCTGQANGFADALALVAPRGTIVLKSTYHGLPTADLTRVAVNEIRIIGSRCGPFDAALRLLEKKLIDVESLIEGRYRLDEGVQAMAYAAEKGVLKVLLTP